MPTLPSVVTLEKDEPQLHSSCCIDAGHAVRSDCLRPDGNYRSVALLPIWRPCSGMCKDVAGFTVPMPTLPFASNGVTATSGSPPRRWLAALVTRQSDVRPRWPSDARLKGTDAQSGTIVILDPTYPGAQEPYNFGCLDIYRCVDSAHRQLGSGGYRPDADVAVRKQRHHGDVRITAPGVGCGRWTSQSNVQPRWPSNARLKRTDAKAVLLLFLTPPTPGRKSRTISAVSTFTVA